MKLYCRSTVPSISRISRLFSSGVLANPSPFRVLGSTTLELPNKLNLRVGFV